MAGPIMGAFIGAESGRTAVQAFILLRYNIWVGISDLLSFAAVLFCQNVVAKAFTLRLDTTVMAVASACYTHLAGRAFTRSFLCFLSA